MQLSTISAIAGTAASITMKFTFGDGATSSAGSLCAFFRRDDQLDSCERVASWGIRLIGLATVLLLNAVMLNALLRAMQASGSVLVTTQTNAISFALAGLAGKFLFGEAVSLGWWLGFGLIVLGLALLSGGAAFANEKID